MLTRRHMLAALATIAAAPSVLGMNRRRLEPLEVDQDWIDRTKRARATWAEEETEPVIWIVNSPVVIKREDIYVGSRAKTVRHVRTMAEALVGMNPGDVTIVLADSLPLDGKEPAPVTFQRPAGSRTRLER